jgi:NADH-quinone oxidoreductase subunit N
MQSEWSPLLPLIILATGGTAIFCLSAFWSKAPMALLFALAITSCLASGGSALYFREAAGSFSGLLAGDDFSSFYTVLFAALTLITLLFSCQYARKRDFTGDEFLGILLFAATGMILIASAIHWLLFFLGLEMLSISLYVLIAIRRGDSLGVEAAVKYFIVGAVASAFVVFGIAMLYGATGTLEIAKSLDLAGNVDSRFLLLFGLCLILVGLGFKISLVPFHLWTPDIYQGAPAPITAFLATGSKVAVLAMFVRLAVYGGDGPGQILAPSLWTMAAFSMIIGNITALAQTRIKRLLAYSSIAQMGYMLMALLAYKQQGTAAVVFYSVVYACMDLGAFGTVGLLSPTDSDRDNLTDYRGLGYTQPGKAALLTLCLFSLAGLPATAGFIGKFVLFRATIEGNFISLAIIGILTAIISLYFYLNIVVALYMRPAEKNSASESTDNAATLACLLIAVLIIWLGIFPSSLLTLVGKIVGQIVHV